MATGESISHNGPIRTNSVALKYAHKHAALSLLPISAPVKVSTAGEYVQYRCKSVALQLMKSMTQTANECTQTQRESNLR